MKYLKVNNAASLRPNEIKKVGTNPKKIFKELNWKAKLNINQIIKKLLFNEIY